MLESGTSELKTLTPGILARKHMSELSIQRKLTKPSCLFQTMPSFVAHLTNCRSIDHCSFVLYFLLIIHRSDVILIAHFPSFRPQDISFAVSITGNRSKLFFTLLMAVCALMSVFGWCSLVTSCHAPLLRSSLLWVRFVVVTWECLGL